MFCDDATATAGYPNACAGDGDVMGSITRPPSSRERPPRRGHLSPSHEHPTHASVLLNTVYIYIYIYLRVCLSGMHAAGLQFRLSTCCYASEVPSPVLLVGSELQEYWFRGLIPTNRVVQPRKELCRVKSGRVCRKRESE